MVTLFFSKYKSSAKKNDDNNIIFFVDVSKITFFPI